MPTMRKVFLGAAVLAVAAAGTATLLQKAPEPEATARPRNAEQPVLVAVAENRSLPIVVSANGYVTPNQIVEVRPRVQNIVREVHVREGQDVKAGQLLFTLDARADETEVQRARAQLGRDLADLAEAQAALRRSQDLVEKGFVSKAALDTAQSRVDALKSTVQANRVAIESASIAAGYNRITASIAGRIGTISVYPGSLAQPAGTPMLTIAQIEPVSVAFSLPERQLADVRATYPDGRAPVTATLPDGTALQGELVFIDSSADAQTGTIPMKARFENRDRRLWPGTFVPVSLVSSTINNAVTIPAQAVINGPSERFVYLVRADGTVERQVVEVRAVVNERAAVLQLPAGARVVSEGMQNLRPGSKVREIQNPPAAGMARPAQ